MRKENTNDNINAALLIISIGSRQKNNQDRLVHGLMHGLVRGVMHGLVYVLVRGLFREFLPNL